MGRHTGPGNETIPWLEVPALAADPEGTPQVVADLSRISVMFDGNGAGTVTGTVQLQGSIGGLEWVNEGAVVSVWPSYRSIAGYYTHLRIKTTANFSAGTPYVRIGGFRD